MTVQRFIALGEPARRLCLEPENELTAARLKDICHRMVRDLRLQLGFKRDSELRFLRCVQAPSLARQNSGRLSTTPKWLSTIYRLGLAGLVVG